MANTIEYGLKFNTKDLEKVIKLSKEANKIASQNIEANKKAAEKYSFYEKEMLMLKKQNLMMAKRLTKDNLKEMEVLYKQYYTRIKGLDKQSADDLTRQQIENIKKRQGLTSNIANVPLRVAKYIGTATVTYGTLAAVRRGVNATMEYDQALKNTYAALGNVTEAEKKQIMEITKNYQLTQKYGKNYAEIAQAMEVLAKAGLDLNSSMQLLEPSLGVAAVSGMKVDESAQILTETLQGLGKPLSEATKLANLLAEGAMASTVDIKDLAESMKIAGPTGRAFGMSMEDIVRWMSAMGTTGLKGRNAANAMARDLLRITKESDKFAKVGINVFDPTTKKLRSFIDILKDVANANLDITEKQKLLGIYAFKSNEQIMAAIPRYEQMAQSIGKNNKALEDMVNTVETGLVKSLTRLKNTWDNIFISQGWIAKSLEGILNLTEAILRNVSRLPDYLGKKIGDMFFSEEELKYIEERKKAIAEKEKQDRDYLSFESSLSGMSKERLIAERELLRTELNKRLQIFNEYTKGVNESTAGPGFAKKRDAYFGGIQDIQRKISRASLEISLFKNNPSVLADGTGGGGAKKPTTDSIDAFMRKMKRMQDEAQNAEISSLTKHLQDIQDLYEQHLQELSQKNLTRADEEKALDAAELTRQDQIFAAYEKQAQENIKKENEDFKNGKENELKLIEEFNDLRLEYDLEYQLQQLQKRELELQGTLLNEQAKFAIREEYAQKTQDLLAAQYEKEHQLSVAFWGSMQSGQQALVNSLIDMDMTGKERREQIWTAFRDFFIRTLAEMLIKYIAFSLITNLVTGGFGSKFGSFLGNMFGVNASFGGGPSTGDIFSGGARFGVGGFNIPSSIPSGTGNREIADRLYNIERRIATGNAQTVSAIENNRPVVSGKFIGEPEIYTMAEVGRKKIKLITT
jgi:TP901 family phage tail tape measure protein